ncbi:putative phospholipid-transporting ATPase VA [Amphibalanus amphitrite]|uniref:Phospholipid-transporting ATPase n=1 Tax=Amphibalanus amphitrite TaxID=1232801 RepID=A0A6A4VR34_AMPAM|nr:putative phospholipid-transporting ATPase VA [Amphibalanus amphitrite]KAF0293173.1 putative phospholipid-transporting ATPase VA [Amphibalanus amphitrite]
MIAEGLVEFEILNVLPFDSDRKRMSVILRHVATQQIILYTKGADSNMLPLVETATDYQSQEILYRTQQQLNVSSRRGLRVLVLAKKNLSEEEYQDWLTAHREAESLVGGREHKLQRSYAAMENRLELLGCTGIEDRLQEGVPETLCALREAGIVVWVLTGDKQETAINIAYSCRLFSQDMEVIKINARSKNAAERTVNFYLDQLERERAEVAGAGGGGGGGGGGWKRRPPTPASLWSTDTASTVERGGKKALVVDGKTLTYFLDSRSQLQIPFLRLTGHCSAVLCCRTTPLQKAYIVRIVKNQLGALTLAVGDGANDVSMIQTADVGVGISGQEGMQAVMASDFALARFRYLQRLLLVHGHWCYDRLARMVLYFLYKNATFVFVIFWYQLYCGFSGAVMIDQIYLSLFNLMFTSLPPFAIGIYDQDCPAELLMAQPHLYNQGRLSQVYKPHSFWVNMADALYQSIVIFFFAAQAYEDTSVDIWEFGTTVTVMCLVTMLLHACIEIKSWTWIHAAAIVLSLVFFFVFALVYNAVCLAFPSLAGSYWVIQMATTDSPTLYLAAVLAGVTAVLPRLVTRSLQHTFRPSPVARAMLRRRRAEESHPMEVLSTVPWSSSTSLSSVSVVRTSEYSGVGERLEQNGMPSVA